MARFDLDPVTSSYLTLRLFRNVRNIPELRKKLIAGKLQGCVINPTLILDPFQVVVAANKALTAEKTTTRTIFTEILFNLSVSKNITSSLQQFGINDSVQDLLVAVVAKNGEIAVDFSKEIEGEEAELGVIEKIRDLAAIRRVYNVGDAEEKSTSLLDSVVSRIATKGLVSF